MSEQNHTPADEWGQKGYSRRHLFVGTFWFGRHVRGNLRERGRDATSELVWAVV